MNEAPESLSKKVGVMNRITLPIEKGEVINAAVSVFLTTKCRN